MEQESIIKYLEKWLDSEMEGLRIEIKRIDDLSELRNKSIEDATTLARESMEHRLEGMNEFRKSLDDVTSTFITRQEYEKSVDSIEKNILSLQLSKATLDGKATVSSVYMGYIFTGIAILFSLIQLILSLK